MEKLWKAWLAGAFLLAFLYFVLDNTPNTKLLLYNGVGLISIVMMVIGVRRNNAQPKGPWIWFIVGLSSFLVADIIYYALEAQHPEGPPFPNIADAFYLGMYPAMIVGLTKMVRHVAPGSDKASFIDAAVVGTAMFGIMWVLFVDDVFSSGSPGLDSALIVSLAYPVMDVALLAVAARLVVTVHLKHPPFAFIVAAIGALAIADTAYQIKLGNGTFATGQFPDAFWLTFYVGFALAALHPSVSRPAPRQEELGRLTGTQLTVMFFATLAVPVVDLFWGIPEDRIVTIGASGLLFLLILVRVFSLMKTIEVGRDRLRHDAEHDSLTGLANRTLFAQKVAEALTPSHGKQSAILFIDLDDFKTINDSLGHEAGDIMLAEVANRLDLCTGEDDIVARFGGDEFAVLVDSAVDRRTATTIARQILEAMNDPIDLGPRVVRAAASIGIAMQNEDIGDVETLMRNADVAMYLAKARGKRRFEFFETEMHEEAVERLDLKADLQRALDENEFVLNYQPIFDLDTGKVELVEALIRWHHPDRGLIQPDRFISLAEESGLIVEIGEWVLREACAQARRWQQIEGYEELSITVNMSMRQLQDHSLVNRLTGALRDSELAARHLVLEITESMLAKEPDNGAGTLSQLKTIGVKLAIDDFGTGYSSLSYLRAFPVDSIKIDRSFISELHHSSTSSALIDAVVNLSNALGAYTVAEGIEHSDQASELRKLGCNYGQGYYYCRPVTGSALTTLLKQHAGKTAALDSWRESSELVQKRSFDVVCREGLAAIQAVSADIVQLNADLGTPVMGCWPWLRQWAESFTSWTPMMIEVRNTESGLLAGCAFLARSQRATGTVIVAMGHGSSLHTSMQARDDGAANALAAAVADTLNDMPDAWSLEIEQFHDLDPTVSQLSDRLEHAQVLPELRVPRVVFATAHTVDDILSKSMRKQLRRAHRKIENEGLELTIAFDRGDAISNSLIDEVEAVHVSRDRHARRNSDLDRPAEREFWRRVVEANGSDWEVEIASLRLNGSLAAYVVALLDGDTYRVYDGRMSTEHQDYSPGRLVEAAALGRALSDPRFAVLDWMSGVAAEKLLVTNMAETRARLVATSGSRFLGSKVDNHEFVAG